MSDSTEISDNGKRFVKQKGLTMMMMINETMVNKNNDEQWMNGIGVCNDRRKNKRITMETRIIEEENIE